MTKTGYVLAESASSAVVNVLEYRARVFPTAQQAETYRDSFGHRARMSLQIYPVSIVIEVGSPQVRLPSSEAPLK